MEHYSTQLASNRTTYNSIATNDHLIGPECDLLHGWLVAEASSNSPDVSPVQLSEQKVSSDIAYLATQSLMTGNGETLTVSIGRQN